MGLVSSEPSPKVHPADASESVWYRLVLLIFAILVLLAAFALFGRHPRRAALWMLLPGVVVHLYPLLLQRPTLLRLQPLLDKTGS